MYKIFTYFPQDKPRTDITHIMLFKTLHNHGFYGCVSVFQFVRTLFAEKDESLLIKYKSTQVKVYFYSTFKNNRVAPKCCTTNTIKQKQ